MLFFLIKEVKYYYLFPLILKQVRLTITRLMVQPDVPERVWRFVTCSSDMTAARNIPGRRHYL